MNFVGDNMSFGKKVTSDNVRRLVRKISWARGTKYEMYRHDYSLTNRSPITGSTRLYDANYYVMNTDYKVYICIDNGSSGISTTGNASLDEPTFTDLEPSKAGTSGDGYLWKYLFTVSPSDIIKFDSTDFISVSNSWSSSTDSQIVAVRDNGDSDVNNNQIKKVYIENQGVGYANGTGQEVNILGDGTGGKVVVDVVNGKVTNAVVSAGGKGYTYGMVDLGAIGNTSASTKASLIPIIPPSKGHGSDIYKELGSDRVLVFARFDTSTTNDFPVNTSFSQIGILKNPTSIGSTSTFTDPTFSSVGALKFSTTNGTPTIGNSVTQVVTGGTAKGFVAAYDVDTKVLKFVQDRSNVLNQTSFDTTDYVGVSTFAKVHAFESNTNQVNSSGFNGSIDTGFTGVSTNPTGTKLISLDTQFTQGVSNPEINKKSGDIVYLDNRPLITRNARQKEDVKIILEF
tara:strand:- start:369 stop:1736 length:1368 start_codon:yes stop_codon:yes gene_type:complete